MFNPGFNDQSESATSNSGKTYVSTEFGGTRNLIGRLTCLR
jgi:hypothetical protein